MILRLDGVLTREEVAKTRVALKNAQFLPGTATGRAAIKQNLQTSKFSRDTEEARATVSAALFRDPRFIEAVFPRRHLMMFNRYEAGMKYGDHIDGALMGASEAEAIRADVSFTIFLSDPESYDGGELVLRAEGGEVRARMAAGDAFLYPAIYLHRVEPVTRGTRLAAVGWVQSFVPDLRMRSLLTELDRMRRDFARDHPGTPYPERMGLVFQNLLRMVAEG